MARSQQRKGAEGERELADFLNAAGFHVKRGGSLTYGTVPDLTGLKGIHIECKRCEALRLTEWLQQSVDDSRRFRDGLPTVFHRKNRQPWLVTMRLIDWLQIYRKSIENDSKRGGLHEIK